MSLKNFFVVIAVMVTSLASCEYYARYESRTKVRELERTVRSAATIGKTRLAVESDLNRIGIKHQYSDRTRAVYGRSVVGRFMFVYNTEYSYVIHFDSDDSVASVASNVFHEGL